MPTEKEFRLVNELAVLLKPNHKNILYFDGNPRQLVYILIDFPLKGVYDPGANPEARLDDSLYSLQKDIDVLSGWMENHEDKTIYFTRNLNRLFISNGAYNNSHSLIFDMAVSSEERLPCINCERVLGLCCKFSLLKGKILSEIHNFQSQYIQILYEHEYHYALGGEASEAGSEVVSSMELISAEMRKNWGKLYSEHRDCSDQCEYRQSSIIDAAYKMANKFRFY